LSKIEWLKRLARIAPIPASLQGIRPGTISRIFSALLYPPKDTDPGSHRIHNPPGGKNNAYGHAG